MSEKFHPNWEHYSVLMEQEQGPGAVPPWEVPQTEI